MAAQTFNVRPESPSESESHIRADTLQSALVFVWLSVFLASLAAFTLHSQPAPAAAKLVTTFCPHPDSPSAHTSTSCLGHCSSTRHVCLTLSINTRVALSAPPSRPGQLHLFLKADHSAPSPAIGLFQAIPQGSLYWPLIYTPKGPEQLQGQSRLLDLPATCPFSNLKDQNILFMRDVSALRSRAR